MQSEAESEVQGSLGEIYVVRSQGRNLESGSACLLDFAHIVLFFPLGNVGLGSLENQICKQRIKWSQFSHDPETVVRTMISKKCNCSQNGPKLSKWFCLQFSKCGQNITNGT